MGVIRASVGQARFSVIRPGDEALAETTDPTPRPNRV